MGAFAPGAVAEHLTSWGGIPAAADKMYGMVRCRCHGDLRFRGWPYANANKFPSARF